ncbi:unnamed protein product [Closterium sp. NIES-54]
MAQSVKLPVARPGRASVSARRAPAARWFLPDARPGCATVFACPRALQSHAQLIPRPPPLPPPDGEGGRGCEGVADSVKLPVARPGRASVSARRAPAARWFLPDARPGCATVFACPRALQSHAQLIPRPPLLLLHLPAARAAVWGGGEGGRGCEGVADVFQQQQLPPCLLSHCCACCCGGGGGGGGRVRIPPTYGPPAYGPPAAPAARTSPACGPLAAPRPARRPLTARPPLLQLARRQLAARQLPLGPLAARATRSPLARGPLSRPCRPLAAPCCPLAACLRPAHRPCSPLAALLRPARHPLQPASCLLQPACRPLQPARRPLRPARHPCSPRAAPLQPHAPSCLSVRRLCSGRASPFPLCCPTGRAPPCLPAMTSLRRSGGSGDGGGDSSGSGCGRSSSRCGAIRWGFSGSGQMQLQRRQRETLPPQQIHECCGGVRARPLRLSNFVSGTLRVGRLGVVLAARTSFAQGVDIFALDYDAILTAMYALTIGTEGDCSLCVLPDPGIEATALGASESALPDTAPAEALHTFMLDSGASRCFFHDSTTLTPLFAPVPVSASSSVAPPSSCRLLSHQTLLWHHRLGHPSLQCLRGMHSRLLVSGLPRSLPPLPPSPALPCLPCVEGRQRATPHSSSFPPTTAPLQTLHMDVWGPDRVSGQGRGRYFLLVVDDYTRYTTIFPLRSKGEVPYVLIPWIRALRLQLRERFRQDLPVLRLHSDRGGEFSSDLLWDFCHGEGILQSFTLPASPQQNGIAKRRIGSVMEVARTSMIHAAAPHFLWPFAVCYIAHQLNLWSRVSLPETSPTLRWTGKVGDASVFRVWGSRALVRDTSVDKLSTLAIPCIFLGFPFDAPGWQFYHPTSRRVFPSQDVTFDKSVSFYRLFPYRSAPLPPSPLFLAPGPPPVDPLPPQGPAPSGVSQVDPLPGTVPVEVAVDSGCESGGAELEGAESEGAESGGAEPGGADSGGAEPRGITSSGGPAAGGSAARGTGAGGVGTTRLGGAGVSARVSAGAGGTKGAGAAGPCGARTRGTGAAGTSGVGGAGAGDPRARGARAGGARAGVPRAGGAGTGGARAGGTGAIDPGAGGSGAGVAVSGGTGAGGTSESGSPASVEGECALGTDVLEDRQEDFECLAAAVPHLVAMLLAPEGDSDAPDIPTPRSYAEAITALGFAPSFADLSLFLRTDTSLPPFYVLVYVDDLVFATGDTEALALVKSGLQKRHTCTDLGPSALRLRVLLAIVHSSAYRSLALSSTFGRVRRAEWPARAPPCPAAREPHCPALQPSASRPATLPSARPTVLHVAPCCSPRVAPYCSPRVALCCPARRALLPCTARALLPCLLRALPCSPRHALPCPAAPPSPAEPRRLARAALPNPSRAALPRSPAPPSRPAAACATAVAGGGAARSVGSAAGAGGAGGSTRSAGGAGGATGSAGGAAGAEGARPNTDHHCLSWPLSRQLQRLGVDSGGHYLSRTTPTLSSFATTPHCRVSTACTPVSLSLAFLGPCPPSRARLPRRAFPASRGGSAPLLTPSSFLRPLLLLQTLHMDIRATRCQLREQFSRDFPVMRLHSDRGGEFSSDLLAEFCRDKGIRQSFMLPASPQQNGIVERRIGLIMEVARTSMIHATSPHFLWSFAVRYAAHQLNLWPRISKPETSPTLRWTGKVGNASVFRVWGALSLVCDAKASKLSSCTLRCVFLGFPTDATLWQLYHPRENRVFSSQDVTFDEFVCFHTLHPHASHPGPAPSGVSQVDPPPLVEPLEISSDSSGLAEGGDSAADDTAATHRSPRLETPPGFPPWLSSPPPQPTAVDSGAETGGAELGGAETEGEGSRDAATGGAATGGAGSGGVVTWGADLGGTASPSGGRAVGDPAGGLGVGQPPQPDLLETLSPQAIRAWIVRRGIPSGGGYGPAGAGASSPRGTAGVGGAGATSPRGATGAEGTRGAAGAGGAGATSPRGATGAGGTRGAAGAGGAGATSPRGATGAGGAGPTSLGGTAGAGGVGGAASAGGAGAGGTGGAGAAGPGGARTRGAGAARAGGATGAAGSGGAGGTAGARGAGAGGNGGAGAAGPGDARVGGFLHLYLDNLPSQSLRLFSLAMAPSPILTARTRGAGAAGAGDAVGDGGAGDTTGAVSTGGTAGAGGAVAGGTRGTGGAGAAGLGGARTRGAGAAGEDGAAGAGGAGGATGARGTGTPGVGGAGGAGSAPRQLFFHPQPQSSLPPPDSVLPRVLSLPSSIGLTPPLLCSSTDQSPPQLLLGSSLPAPAPHTELVVLPEPPTSSLPHVTDLESDFAHAASPTVTRLLATVINDPHLESTAAFALVSELVEFAARSRLNYVASLVTESAFVCPPSVEGEPALSSDVLEDRQFELECLAIALPRFASMLLCLEGDPDALDIPTPHSYAEAIAAQRDYELHSLDFSTAFLHGSLHEEIWLRRPPGFTVSFPAGTQTTLAALGFSSSSADPSLFLRTDTTMSPFYVLVYVDDLVFATTDTEALALVKAELQERHTCTDLGEMRSYLGLQITRDRARCIITLTQSHMVHQVLQRFGFQFSSPQPTPPSTGHSLSAPPSDESVEPSGPYPELVGCLMYLMMCTRPNLAYPLSLLARYMAPGRHRKVHWDVAKRVLRYLCSTSGMGLVLGGRGSVLLTGHSGASWADDKVTQRSSQGYTFSLGSGFVSWRSTHSSSVLGSSCEAKIYAKAMAAQELRWLTYLLTDLGERPRSPPVLYVDNKAMLAFVS